MIPKKSLGKGMEISCEHCPLDCECGTSPVIFEDEGETVEVVKCKVVRRTKHKVFILKPINITLDHKGDHNIAGLKIDFRIVPYYRFQ